MTGNLSLDEQLAILTRGCQTILTLEELRAKLQQARPLRVKLGVDPTAPDIHLGHTVALSKMRQFQDLGHIGVLILGNFTAMIGDPTGRSTTRPQLSQEEVLANAATYREQAFKVLDPERTEVVFNGDWFFPMKYEEVLRLNSRITLQQMLQREDFRERIQKAQPIHAHELQYPIMQGWDSVMVRADVELGGTDQLFNVMVGRDLQTQEGQPAQVGMLLPILVGTDGSQKMSKSLGNAIGVTEPPEQMFGKIMSIPDSALPQYYELLLGEELSAEGHPMEQKKHLAFSLVARFHSRQAAQAALDDFVTRFSKRDLAAADLPQFTPTAQTPNQLLAICAEAYQACFGLTPSKSEIRRLIQGGSVQWNGQKMTNPHSALPLDSIGILKLDKIRAVRLVPPRQ